MYPHECVNQPKCKWEDSLFVFYQIPDIIMMIKSELQNVKLWVKLSLQSCSSRFQFLQKYLKWLLASRKYIWARYSSCDGSLKPKMEVCHPFIISELQLNWAFLPSFIRTNTLLLNDHPLCFVRTCFIFNCFCNLFILYLYCILPIEYINVWLN